VHSLLTSNTLVHTKEEAELFNTWLLSLFRDPPVPVPKEVISIIEEAARLSTSDRHKVEGIALTALYPLLTVEDAWARGARAGSGTGGASMLCAVLYLLHRRDCLMARQGDSRLQAAGFRGTAGDRAGRAAGGGGGDVGGDTEVLPLLDVGPFMDGEVGVEEGTGGDGMANGNNVADALHVLQLHQLLDMLPLNQVCLTPKPEQSYALDPIPGTPNPKP